MSKWDSRKRKQLSMLLLAGVIAAGSLCGTPVFTLADEPGGEVSVTDSGTDGGQSADPGGGTQAAETETGNSGEENNGAETQPADAGSGSGTSGTQGETGGQSQSWSSGSGGSETDTGGYTGGYEEPYGNSTGESAGTDLYGGYSFDDSYDYDTTVYGPDTGDYSGGTDSSQYVYQETADTGTAGSSGTSLNYTLSNGRKLLIIGDSRTVGMRLAVSDFRKNVTWCCLGGKGYNWMTAVGVPAVESLIDDRTDVVCLMGVNDAWDESADQMLPQYSSYINKKAQAWRKKGARTYYVSVNPIRADYMLGTYHVSNDSVVYWNEYMQTHLSRNVTYIDTYRAICDHMNYSDDIHYQGSTYRDIFRIICASVQADGMGWTSLAGARYFAWDNGALGSEGWLHTGGKQYYLNYDGSMYKGWKTIGGNTFFLKSDGTVEKGKTKIRGKEYIFNELGALISDELPALEAEAVG